jgi:hypothetical protein
MQLYTQIIWHLQTWFRQFIEKFEMKKFEIDGLVATFVGNTNIFCYNTLSNVGHYMFKASISKNCKLYSLPSQIRSDKNYSKIEIITCIILNDIHCQTCPEQDIYSVISGDCSQFRPTGCKVSADFFCGQCKTSYFIEGTFKSSCYNHNTDTDKILLTDFNENLNRKLETFKNFAKDYCKRIVVLNECCLRVNIFY